MTKSFNKITLEVENEDLIAVLDLLIRQNNVKPVNTDSTQTKLNLNSLSNNTNPIKRDVIKTLVDIKL